jgi:WD40 repeat protein
VTNADISVPSASIRRRRRPFLDRFFGYDYFIAHRSNDGKAYAHALHKKLTGLAAPFRCFIDRRDYSLGGDLRQMQTAALRKSTRLIVIVTPGALLPPDDRIDWLLGEVREFKARHRLRAKIVPIGTMQTLDPAIQHHSVLLTEIPHWPHGNCVLESEEGQLLTEPSEETIARLIVDFVETRQERNRLRLFEGLAGGLLLLLLIAVVSGIAALGNARRAREQEMMATQRADELAKTTSTFLLGAAAEYFAKEELGSSLAYLAEALRTNPENGSARDLAATILLSKPWYLPVYAGWKHHSYVRAAHFSPDGELAVAIARHSVRLWNTRTGAAASDEFIYPDDVSCAKFSPEKMELATAAGALVQIRDTASGKPIGIDLQHEGEVQDLTYSPNGHQLAVALSTGELRIWNTETWKALHTLPLGGSLTYVSYSPNGELVGAASSEGMARVWNAITGKPLGPLLKHETAKGWSGHTDERFLGAPLEAPPSSTVKSVEFSPDNSAVVTSGVDGTARLWEISTGKALIKPLRHDHSVNKAVFVPTGMGLGVLTGSDDKTARLWDNDVKPRAVLNHKLFVTDVATSPDGFLLATVCGDYRRQAGYARIWHAGDGGPRGDTLPEDSDVEFHPRDSRLLTASSTGAVRVWDLFSSENRFLHFLHGRALLKDLALDRAGKFLVATFENGAVETIDIEQGRISGAPLKHSVQINLSAFLGQDTELATAGEDGIVRIWSLKDRSQPLLLLDNSAPVSAMAIHPDGKRLAVGCKGGITYFWNLSPSPPTKMLLEGEPHDDVKRLEFSRDGSLILVERGDDALVRVWNTETGKELPHHFGQKTTDRIGRASFAPDGKHIAIAFLHGVSVGARDLVKPPLTSVGGSALVFDIQSGKVTAGPFRHPHQVSSLSFSPDGKLLVTASLDKTAQVWSLETGQPVGKRFEHSKAVFTAGFSPDSRLVVTNCFVPGEGQGFVTIWDISSGKPIGPPIFSDSGYANASFSPDGRWLVLQSGMAAIIPIGCGNSVRRCPPWFADFIEMVGGFKLIPGTQQLMNVDADLRNRISLTRYLERENAGGDLGRLADWFVTPIKERTVFPFTNLSTQQWINDQIEESAEYTLDSVLRVDPANVSAWIRKAQLAVEQWKANTGNQRFANAAIFCMARAERLEPRNQVVQDMKRHILKEISTR